MRKLPYNSPECDSTKSSVGKPIYVLNYITQPLNCNFIEYWAYDVLWQTNL